MSGWNEGTIHQSVQYSSVNFFLFGMLLKRLQGSGQTCCQTKGLIHRHHYSTSYRLTASYLYTNLVYNDLNTCRPHFCFLTHWLLPCPSYHWWHERGIQPEPSNPRYTCDLGFRTIATTLENMVPLRHFILGTNDFYIFTFNTFYDLSMTADNFLANWILVTLYNLTTSSHPFLQTAWTKQTL